MAVYDDEIPLVWYANRVMVTVAGDLLSCYKNFAGDEWVKLVFMIINWKKYGKEMIKRTI
jgi:hypothetical protein